MKFFTYDISSISPVKLCIIPMVILVISLVSVGLVMMQTGLPIHPGIEFQGGISVTIVTDDTPEEIEAYFSGYPLIAVEQGINNGKYLKFGPMDDQNTIEFTKKVEEKYTGAKIDQIGSSFGKTLQDQAIFALLISFIGMAIVVFLIFRTFVPSAAIVLSAFADMVMTAGAMNLLGYELSLGTTAALLMLIGYSVDSDILLTSRVLKRKGKFDEKIQGAYRTGIIMTSTAFAAALAMWIASEIGGIQIISEIASVILIGLVFDIMNTWLTNAGIIKWYMTEGKGRLSSSQRGA
ncbi:MAG: protein translocase subunit SecF [Methanospirillum sp.]|nr:protein translocase subunit SecF [Methanospirillum sp.]